MTKKNKNESDVTEVIPDLNLSESRDSVQLDVPTETEITPVPEMESEVPEMESEVLEESSTLTDLTRENIEDDCGIPNEFKSEDESPTPLVDREIEEVVDILDTSDPYLEDDLEMEYLTSEHHDLLESLDEVHGVNKTPIQNSEYDFELHQLLLDDDMLDDIPESDLVLDLNNLTGPRSTESIAFLDAYRYPNWRDIFNSLESSGTFLVESFSELEMELVHQKSDLNIKLFTLDPVLAIHIHNLGLGDMLYNSEIMDFFNKELIQELRSANADLLLPKLRVSATKETDLLEVARFLKLGSHSTITYVNGGTKNLIPYTGLEFFNVVSSLRSGVIYPTKPDELNLDMESKFIIQFVKDSVFCMELKQLHTPDNSLSWVEVRDCQEDLIEIATKFNRNDYPHPIYLDLVNYGDQVLIDKITPGFHPFSHKFYYEVSNKSR